MFVKAIVALAAAIASPVVILFAKANTCSRTYTIKTGDICDSISASQNVSSYQLAVVNIDTIDATCSNLTPGNSICLGYQGEDCTSVYVVKGGDTCDEITSAYGINATLLWSNNPQINAGCTNIYVGEVLCVANAAEDYSQFSSLIQSPSSTSSYSIPSTTFTSTTTTFTSTSTSTTFTTYTSSEEDLPYCDEL